MSDEIGPENSQLRLEMLREGKTYLQASYADQQIAVLGIVVTTRGLTPLKKPLKPSRLSNNRHPSINPLTCRSSGSEAVPLVCSIVLTTSIGVVSAAANPPATAPAEQCVTGSYTFLGFMNVEIDS